jgi:hypothetical protein
MAIAIGPKIDREQLILAVDAADLNSYPQTGASWFDLGPSGLSATLVNSPTFSTPYGGGLQFNGTSSRADISGFPFAVSSQMTFNIWFEQTTSGTTVNPRFFGKYEDVSNGYQFGGAGVGFTQFVFRLDYTGTQYSVRSAGAIEFNKIYNTTIVFNSGLAFYINGTLDNSIIISGYLGAASSAATLSLGTLNSNFFNGKIYAFNIYNKAFTASEVKNLYNTFKPRFKLN